MTSQQRLYLVVFFVDHWTMFASVEGPGVLQQQSLPCLPESDWISLHLAFRQSEHTHFASACGYPGPPFFVGAPRNPPHFLWLRHRSYILWETRVGGMYFERASWLTNWRGSYCYWIQRTPSGQNAELLLSLEWGSQIWPFQGTTSENMTEFLGCPT